MEGRMIEPDYKRIKLVEKEVLELNPPFPYTLEPINDDLPSTM